jgi:hypothetical protein
VKARDLGKLSRPGENQWKTKMARPQGQNFQCPEIFSAAKLRLADFEREERAKGKRSAAAAVQVEGGRCGKLLEIYLADMRSATGTTGTRASTKFRTETSVKALLKTWPDFPCPRERIPCVR